MEAKELRQFSAEDLKGRVRQWREELFRSRFKGQTSEARDTSIYRKLKKDIARALTIMNQTTSGAAPVAPVQDKPVAPKKTVKAAAKTESVAADKPAKAKTAKKKKAE